MNILFITEDHSPANSGVTTVVSQIIDQLLEQDKDINVVVVATNNKTVEQNTNVSIEIINPNSIGKPWKWSPVLMSRVDSIIKSYKINLIHIHGIWMAAQWAGLRAAKKHNLPAIISSHGMLEPWLWNEQGFLKKAKKYAYFQSLFKPQINGTTIFHAITPVEKENILKIFPRNRIEVIPNAIELLQTPVINKEIEVKKQLLFLGRIHPIKGINLIVDAISQINLDPEWKILIAGPVEIPNYLEELKRKVIHYNLAPQVQFLGPIYGQEKYELIQSSWTMLVPSYSEVISMVNLEAASCNVPSITTHETGLEDWENGGGILIKPTVKELSEKIVEVTRWSKNERILRGEASRKLVEEKYSWESVIPTWRDFYKKVIEVSL